MYWMDGQRLNSDDFFRFIVSIAGLMDMNPSKHTVLLSHMLK